MADTPEPRDPGVSTSRPLFADEPQVFFPNQADVPLPSQSKPKRSVYSRVLLPAVVFLIGIACIAWAAQYLPGRGKSRPPSTQVREVLDAIQFEGRRDPRQDPREAPIWPALSPDEKDNITDYELGVRAFRDYRFQNVSAGEVELGVFETSCGCSSVQVCVFTDSQQKERYGKSKEASDMPWTAVDVDRSLRKVIHIPAKAEGVLRISWTGKTEPERWRLDAKVWSRASGGEQRTMKVLEIKVNYVRPALFDTERLDLGTLNSSDKALGSLYCWSATRDIEVSPASLDPRIKVEVVPLQNDGRKALEDRLLQVNAFTRVRSAYKINVTLLEEHEGKQLELGLILKSVPLTIKSDGVEITVPLPVLRAYVRGDVVLAGSEDGGRIDLKIFSAKLGTSRKMTLTAPKEGKLVFVGCEPALLDLDVTLKALPAGGGKAHWEMEVSAKPNRNYGPLPEDGVVVLRLELPAVGDNPAMTREMRLPVMGTAGSH